MDALGFLLVLFGVPAAIFAVGYLLLCAAARPALRAQRDRQIERDLRVEIADASARQTAARKILREHE